MPTYLLAPGAWLTLGTPEGAALNPPVHAWRAALNPPILQSGSTNDAGLNPPIQRNASADDAGLNPEPKGKGRGNALDPAQAAAYPGWSFEGFAALQAQALRRTALKVVRQTDPPAVPPSARAIGVSRTRPRRDDPFWRWGSEFRVQAVVAELASRVLVQDKSLFHVQDTGSPGKPSLSTDLLVRLEPTRNRNFIDDQRDRVARAAVEREDRLPEILTQMNGFVPFFGSLTGLDLAAAPHAAELMAVWSQWADLYVMALKNAIAERRPFQQSSLVMPIIATPPHGSLPSGHATAATMMSELLRELLYEPTHPRAAQLDRLARRIAFNRVVAGVHFQMDSAAGYCLGRQLAGLFAALATATPPPGLQVHKVVGHADLPEIEAFVPPQRQGAPVAKAPLLAKLWARAVDELELLRV